MVWYGHISAHLLIMVASSLKRGRATVIN